MWMCESGGGREAQIWSKYDLREHVTDGGPCWCNPRIEKHEDGAVAMVVHRSADNREMFEPDRIGIEAHAH